MVKHTDTKLAIIFDLTISHGKILYIWVAGISNHPAIFMGISEIEYEKLLWGKSGIYMWTSPSGKKYVGLSDNLGNRHKDFRCASDNRAYAGINSIIDKARKKYPYDQWHYEVLEFCSIDLLGEREKYWIAYYQTNNNKY